MSRRTRVIDTLDRHNRTMSRAIVELSDKYEAYLNNAATSGIPPSETPPDVVAAHQRYRRTVANVRASVRRTKKGTPDRATALNALGALGTTLKNIEDGMKVTNLKQASDAATAGHKKVSAYRSGWRRLRRRRRRLYG